MFFRYFAAIAVVAALGSSCASSPTITPLEVAAPAAASEPAPTPVPLGRQASIDSLVRQSFLPQDAAVCVVEALHDASNVWDPSSSIAADYDVATLVGACTAYDENSEEPKPVVRRTRNGAAVDDSESETAEPLGPFELTEASMPAFSPGSTATGQLELDGTTIDYVTITPAGFQVGDTAPVFLAFGPGGQDLRITTAVVDVMYYTEALARGWVVVSPAAPNGKKFSDGAEKLVPEMMRWIEAWVTPEGGGLHVGGMSNGGISAFRVAAQNSDSIRSLMVFPGFPRSNSDKKALKDLASIPVHMWVGGNDSSWVRSMEDTADDLRSHGGDVTLEVLAGEPHVLESTQDGKALFTALDAAR